MDIYAQYLDIAEQLQEAAQTRTLVYVGRFCPMHYGHQAMIGGIIEASGEIGGHGHIIFVGSCNHPISCRHMFDLDSRVRFIKKVHTRARIAPIADYQDDAQWLAALDLIISLAGINPANVTFVGGCQEDISWFTNHGRRTIIVNRFSGITQNISGTEIRDHLINGNKQRLGDLLDIRIIDDVVDTAKIQWDKLRKQ